MPICESCRVQRDLDPAPTLGPFCIDCFCIECPEQMPAEECLALLVICAKHHEGTGGTPWNPATFLWRDKLTSYWNELEPTVRTALWDKYWAEKCDADDRRRG